MCHGVTISPHYHENVTMSMKERDDMYKYVAWLIQCPSAGPCVINKCNAAMVLFSKPQGVDIHLPIWANYMLPSAKPRSGAPIPVNLKLEHTALFFFSFFFINTFIRYK